MKIGVEYGRVLSSGRALCVREIMSVEKGVIKVEVSDSDTVVWYCVELATMRRLIIFEPLQR